MFWKIFRQSNGGCSPVNWLSQTRRKLTIEFLDLNFASRRKLCKHSVFCENMNTVAYILFRKVFIFSRFCLFTFRKCITLLSLSDIDILRDSVPNLKISTKSVTADISTGWFVTVANFAPQLFWVNLYGKILDGKLSNVEMWCHVRAISENF